MFGLITVVTALQSGGAPRLDVVTVPGAEPVTLDQVVSALPGAALFCGILGALALLRCTCCYLAS